MNKMNRVLHGARYARPHRQEQIVDFALERGEFTISQLAKYLGVKPSQHLRSIVWEMVDDGRVVAIPYEHWNKWVKWVFELSEPFKRSMRNASK